MGEGSETACRAAIRRAIDAKKPLRILYISDFDPGGRSMPLAVARKIEFWINTKEIDLDAAVEPLALLPEQVEHYRLPKVPIKETERRSANFEKRRCRAGRARGPASGRTEDHRRKGHREVLRPDPKIQRRSRNRRNRGGARGDPGSGLRPVRRRDRPATGAVRITAPVAARAR
jgi:hypothetical protein